MKPEEYYADRLKALPVFAQLKQARTEIEALVDVEDSALHARLARIKNIFAGFESSLSGDPMWLPYSTIANAGSVIDSIRTEVANFRSNRNPGHLDNANNNADALLIYASYSPKDPKHIRAGAAQALSRAQADATEMVGALRAEIAVVSSSITELADSSRNLGDLINQKTASFSQDIQRFGQRYAEEEESRRGEARHLFDSLKGDATTTLAEQRVVAERGITETRAVLDTAIKSHNDAAEDALSHIKEVWHETEHLRDMINETGVISGFQRVANRAGTESRWWKAIAFMAIVAVGGTAVLYLGPAAAGKVDISWISFASRALLLSILGVIGAYAAVQASRAGQIEEQNRLYELQLSSINPFISDLNSEKREEIKTKLVDRMFGPREVIKDGGPEVTNTLAMITQLVKELRVKA